MVKINKIREEQRGEAKKVEGKKKKKKMEILTQQIIFQISP